MTTGLTVGEYGHDGPGGNRSTFGVVRSGGRGGRPPRKEVWERSDGNRGREWDVVIEKGPPSDDILER